jgi:hypothetical protein
VDFGFVQIGDVADTSFTVVNTGTEPLLGEVSES